MQRSCFHLSIPAIDLEQTVRWYTEGLGCQLGRRSADAVILGLAGHQLVAQRLPAGSVPEAQRGIYPRHFGLVFDRFAAWQALRDRVQDAGLAFAVAPKCRFPGERLEHHTFFLIDPSGNWLEFKHYSHPEAILGCIDQAVVGDASLRLDDPQHSVTCRPPSLGRAGQPRGQAIPVTLTGVAERHGSSGPAMSDTGQRNRDHQLRGRARLLEFLKFRVLASQEAFFAAWHPQEDPQAPGDPTAPPAELPPLDLVAFRRWLQPLWPEAAALGDDDLRHCLEQAHRLYVDPGPQRRA